MIIIKHIEFLEVKGERHEFYDRYLKDGNQLMEVGTASGTAEAMTEEIAELIKGREFRSPSGYTVVVGVSKQAQDIIGIQYEAWENQSRLVDELSLELGALQMKTDHLQKEIEKKQSELNEIKGASFWIRLKWLFAGYNPAATAANT